ncbi:helix-turn-helix domain-containing protein [Flavobacteriaceae bacterium R38]|nr:helix-turn-helix domain-containing protein [Flavobacteriaceae bacterium R38]
MILIEECPNNPDLTKYIDRYQLFISEEPVFIKAIPNGKIECYLIKKGGFARWDNVSEEFIDNASSGIFPATNRTTFFYIPSHIVCLNIKINLNILGLQLFSNLQTNWQSHDISDLIPANEQSYLLSSINEENPIIDVDKLDAVIERSLSNYQVDKKVDQIVKLIHEQVTSKFRVTDLANYMNMSPKTLERWVRKQFNLSPKELLQVIRFEFVSRSLKNQSQRKFMDSTEFGYYDQSHFIKECQNITGYTPKEFFSRMKLSTNDLVFE